jgi:c-di-GMP-binding flagellar brake protein YcgR
LTTERRRYERVTIPVSYRISGLSTAKRSVLNMSLGGVRIDCDENLDIGQMLELEFFLPNGISIEVSAKVVWIKRLPPGSEAFYDVGMEFQRLSEVAVLELDAVLNKE